MNVKEVTIYDIAKVLNVSPATVSRGLKNHPAIHRDTKKRIAEAAHRMGYQQNTFASNLRRKSSNTIGVIIPRLNSYFMSTVISGMEKVANAHGYNLLISQSQESYKREIDCVSTMYNSRVDGLLISVAFDTQKTEHFETLLRRQIPLIFFDRIIEHPECTSIVIDNKKAGYEGTKHLIEQGCRRIVHVEGNINQGVFADRLQGYRYALQDARIEFDAGLVINCNLSDAGGTAAAQQILAMTNRPDGIFTANDTAGVACIRQIKMAGLRVPKDIAVVGFNNDPISTVIEPNLTTINYPGSEMGEIAATTLINRLKKGSVSNLNTVVLRHSLIVRESSLKIK
jgi:LacI family transcriptional regulator